MKNQHQQQRLQYICAKSTIKLISSFKLLLLLMHFIKTVNLNHLKLWCILRPFR
ncbi:unnamed protein product [Moneuplotes crassus]|uniref:Uncharacterized protein n=1 Tax=Euplotes crassus TaxID=5936 RepID=A0AAD2D457_EUPCR|nr:unnamed protein product [Moneuplotes crassus]